MFNFREQWWCSDQDKNNTLAEQFTFQYFSEQKNRHTLGRSFFFQKIKSKKKDQISYKFHYNTCLPFPYSKAKGNPSRFFPLPKTPHPPNTQSLLGIKKNSYQKVKAVKQKCKSKNVKSLFFLAGNKRMWESFTAEKHFYILIFLSFSSIK